MNEWQPIETAPKDIGDVLIFNEDGIDIGWWDDNQKEWCYRDLYLTIRSPSHWMPLPEPPK